MATTNSFEYSPDGYSKAKDFLIEINRWDEVSTKGFSNDGWSVVAEANSILARIQNEGIQWS